MRPPHRSRLLMLGTLLLPVTLALLALLLPGLNPEVELFGLHAGLVGTVAVLAVVLSLLIGQVGARQRNVQVTLLSLAFASLTLVYGVHGLAAPELGMDGMSDMAMASSYDNPMMPVAAQLGALLTATWLWLSSLASDTPALRRLARLRGSLSVLWLLVLTALMALLFVPGMAHRLVPDGVWSSTLLVLTTLLCGVAGRQYWQSWRYSRFPVQLAIVYASGWLGGAQLIIALAPAWTVAWWLYHVMLVGVTAAVVVGLLSQQRGPQLPLGTVVRGLWNNDPDDLLAAGLSVSVQQLVLATERHDPYTAGHSYRVALQALRLARVVGCGPEALRAITQGGVLHDLGKLNVAYEVLNSPARLTPEQWAQIQQHPLYGYERCRQLGYLPEELGIIRSHHERWDGTGYPDRLAGDAIPLLARILSVADVYDALTSQRAYRQPWSHQQANQHLQEEAGRMFDPALVDLWLQLPPLDLGTTSLPDWALPTSTPGPFQVAPI
ncbi:HD-GYP domain-containing protein [Deinococcus sonorensis]|uniref:HD-GYP domain-containing protein n=2 Tax=Deinococcus sonorensis TaxID=309891 RepID=A0AAU7UBY3_9DEIO